ncbi:MAG: LysR family transcriptional regulator [Pyrinomonadaceae bacterium]|nr:LysR family transcriptional regulator [Pyrinomonadaceae bacterium]
MDLAILASMDVRDLEVFLAVAKRLNFTRAGEDVHLSQPSVSIRVRQLEQELGVRLFEQLGKKIALTDAGKLLEPHARRVVAAVDDARRAIEEYQGLASGVLCIGASTTPGMYLVPRIIAEFKRKHPKVVVHLGIKNTRQVEEGILSNDFDLGFVGGHLIGKEVEATRWMIDELILIMPPDHPLAARKQIRMRELTKERFVSRERGSATRAVVEEYLHKLQVEVETVMELSNPEAVKGAVRSGLGVAFMSKFAVETEVRAGALVAKRVKEIEISREMKIVYRKDKHLSKAMSAFIETARSLR